MEIFAERTQKSFFLFVLCGHSVVLCDFCTERPCKEVVLSREKGGSRSRTTSNRGKSWFLRKHRATFFKNIAWIDRELSAKHKAIWIDFKVRKLMLPITLVSVNVVLVFTSKIEVQNIFFTKQIISNYFQGFKSVSIVIHK